MSGGSWEYVYSRVEDAADRLCESQDTLRRAFGEHLKLCAKALHDVEWVDSSDYGKGADVEAIRAVVAPAMEAGAAVELLQEQIARARKVLARLEDGRRQGS